MKNMKKTALATALTATMGISTSASADIITMSFTGLFTLVTPTGAANFNPDVAGFRTPVSGTGSFDTANGAGSATIFRSASSVTARLLPVLFRSRLSVACLLLVAPRRVLARWLPVRWASTGTAAS